MGKHHSSICEDIANCQLSENGRYDCLINGKKIEFKETNIYREKIGKKYFQFVLSLKDIEYSDFLIFINNCNEKYYLIKTTHLEESMMELIVGNVKKYTSISESKVKNVAILESDNHIYFSQKIREII